jgi:hypothetical protein
MPLWFEIAVTVILAIIAVSLIDLCFQFESINRNICNFGSRLEGEVLPRLEAAIRGNSRATLNDE